MPGDVSIAFVLWCWLIASDENTAASSAAFVSGEVGSSVGAGVRVTLSAVWICKPNFFAVGSSESPWSNTPSAKASDVSAYFFCAICFARSAVMSALTESNGLTSAGLIPVSSMMWYPKSVSTGSLNSFSLRANSAFSNGGTSAPRPR